MTKNNSIQELIKTALKEDIGKGDVTTKLVLPQKKNVTAAIIAKEKGVLAGINIAQQVFYTLDKKLKFLAKQRDGNRIAPNTTIALVSGDARSILTAERTALNFMQHLSGIATTTSKYVSAVKGTKAQILDTRKTIPGLRTLEKYAVRVSGGRNHRFGLDYMILIKANHIKTAGGIEPALLSAKKGNRKRLKLEIEVKNLGEVKTALSLNARLIMLDNMGLKEMRKAVRLGKAKFEASGGINLRNVRKVAKTGVDYISVGALTHSAPALDISLQILG